MRKWIKENRRYIIEYLIITFGIIVFMSGFPNDKNAMIWGVLIMWAGVITGHNYRIEELEKKIKVKFDKEGYNE